jgi:hypothetical protein
VFLINNKMTKGNTNMTKKYIFRTLHLGTFAFLFGNLICDWIFGKRSDAFSGETTRMYALLHAGSGLILMISGLINMIILIKEGRYKKDFYSRIWRYLLYAKFALTLTLTPILDAVVPNSENKGRVTMTIRLVAASVAFLVSPFMRYFREGYLTKSEDDEVDSKRK